MGNHICNNIQAIRINRGYSQADLAKKINLSANHYGKIERGKATLTEKNFANPEASGAKHSKQPQKS